jgi:uncharacterized protein YjbI with pentapeptide repeats
MGAWRATPGGAGLVPVALRGFDLSGLDLPRAALQGGDLPGTICSDANLGARLEGATPFKAAQKGADLAGQFLNCAQLVASRNPG